MNWKDGLTAMLTAGCGEMLLKNDKMKTLFKLVSILELKFLLPLFLPS
jgi:hypothetical protein